MCVLRSTVNVACVGLLSTGPWKEISRNHSGPSKSPVVIRYLYARAGRYSVRVRVHNPFGEAETFCCRNITSVKGSSVQKITVLLCGCGFQSCSCQKHWDLTNTLTYTSTFSGHTHTPTHKMCETSWLLGN